MRASMLLRTLTTETNWSSSSSSSVCGLMALTSVVSSSSSSCGSFMGLRLTAIGLKVVVVSVDCLSRRSSLVISAFGFFSRRPRARNETCLRLDFLSSLDAIFVMSLTSTVS